MKRKGMRWLRVPFPQMRAQRARPEHFIVATVGYTASQWLADVLHRHPSISCSHGAHGARFEFGHYGGELKRIWHSDVPTYKIMEEYQVERKRTMLISQFMEELREAFPASEVWGNVHAFTLAEVKGKLAQEADRRFVRELRFFNLVRHPISYLWSVYGSDERHLPPTQMPQTDAEAEYIKNHIELLRPHFPPVTGHPIFKAVPEPPPENVENLFDHFRWAARLKATAWTYNVIAEVSRFPNTTHVAMERLTSEASYFKRHVGYLIGERRCTDEFAAEALATQKLNSKSDEAKAIDPLAPVELFDRLEPWQKDAVRALNREFDLARVFSGTGYKFHFIG